MDRQAFLKMYGSLSLFSLTVEDIEPLLPEALSFDSDEAAERFVERLEDALAWYFDDWDDAVRAAIPDALSRETADECA